MGSGVATPSPCVWGLLLYEISGQRLLSVGNGKDRVWTGNN